MVWWLDSTLSVPWPRFSPWWRNGDHTSHAVRTKIKGIYIVFLDIIVHLIQTTI